MATLNKITTRIYIITNVLLAFVFFNLLAFGRLLRMGDAFSAGLLTGIGAGWALFAFVGWRELRKPGRSYDERIAEISKRASFLAFWVLMAVITILQLVLRSEALGVELGAEQLMGMLMNLGFITWIAAFFLFSLKL